MGVNWESGLLSWKDHTPSATDKHPARVVQLYVSFGLHTFTRATEAHDRDHEIYRDNREARTFCAARYRRSFELPGIFRTLDKRRCEFARGMSGLVNYVTMETSDGERYAAFCVASESWDRLRCI